MAVLIDCLECFMMLVLKALGKCSFGKGSEKMLVILISVLMQVVDQENLETVEEVRGPVVICIAAWFGNVRLIDNIEINL